MKRVALIAAGSLVGMASSGLPLAAQVHDDKVYTFVLVDQLEYLATDGDPIGWDAEGWIGDDYDKFWFKTEGEHSTAGGEGELEVQALYSRLISPFWDLQVGVRTDGVYGGEVDRLRGLAAFGVEGLAPYWFEVQAAVFVSHEGDISFRGSSTYDVFVSQRLIFQPSVELNVAIQEVPEFGVGSGFNDFELGSRLRYELSREFAPYIGLTWLRRLGETADFARAEGGEASELALVGGVRLWF